MIMDFGQAKSHHVSKLMIVGKAKLTTQFREQFSAEIDHGLTFLRNHGFSWVDAKIRRGEVERSRIFSIFRRRGNRIAEADIHLHRYPSNSQASLQRDSHPVVFLLFANLVAPDTFRKKSNPVHFCPNKANFLKNLYEPGDGAFPEPKQVNISRDPMGRAAPKGKEHGPLEDEPIPEIGATQTVQEPFQNETGEDELKILALVPGHIQETLPHGGGNVGWVLSGHDSASR